MSSPKFIQQGTIVPERAIAFSLKPVRDWFANFVVIGQDGTGVVQFVGNGNQSDICVRVLQMLEIVFLALPPRWLGIEISIGAAVDHVSYALAEAAADFSKDRDAATIFDNVVQERGDGKIFITSCFEHEAGNA